jgi:hypothetical protein
MIQQAAKELSLEVWRYFVEHPEAERKRDLPDEIYDKIKNLANLCPLCELFFDPSSYCPGCPLSGKNYYCDSYGKSYFRWVHQFGWSKSAKGKREKAAQEIVYRTEAWKVKK